MLVRALPIVLVLAAVSAAVARAGAGGAAATTTSTPTTSTPTTSTPTSAATTSTPATTLPPSTGPAVNETTVRFFEPYRGDRLLAGIRVTGTRSGYCFTGSLPVDDPHAWRCIAGRAILDPCFAPPRKRSPRQLACGSPWAGVTLLDLTKPLPLADANHGLSPTAGWLLQLAGGVRCQLAQGVTAPEHGVRIAYLCSGGAEAGPLRWAQQPWTVELVRAHATRPTVVAVRTAWGG